MKLLTTADIAEMLRMNVAHVRDRVTHRPDFPRPFVVGGKKLYKKEEVEAWIESLKVAA